MMRLGWLVLGCLIACGAEPTASIQSDISALQSDTTPAGARLVGSSPIARSGFVVTASWDVEATMSWEDYVQRASARLLGYQRARADDGHVTFVRMIAGDTYRVRMEVVAVGPPLRVRVTFESVAS